MEAKKRFYNCLIHRLPLAKLKHKNFARPLKIPVSIDLRSKMPPIYDQKQLGSCTANALACAYEVLNKNLFVPSRLFIYYNERKLEHDIPEDSGALLSDGIKTLELYGVCPEDDWPYDISKFTSKPTAKCYEIALKHKVIKALNVLQDLTAMKTCLINGYPFVVGIAVYSSFESDEVAKSGNVPLPNVHKEELLGGHAVVCVGYDASKEVWIMRNSWGTSWGNNGYFTLPFTYLLDSSLSSDLWAITLESNT
jgi:C1A family cysteine protease